MQIQMNFHNSIRLQGHELTQAQSDCKKQQEKVLEIFKKHPDHEFTPCEIWSMMKKDKIILLTSVRRAITNLTNAGALFKTGKQRKGIYGKSNYTWTLDKTMNI